MTSKVIYEGDLRATSIHLASGSSFETDAPVDNHGKGARFSPTDTMATALASCMLTTMGIACNVHQIDMVGAECNVEKIMVANPRRIGEIKVWMSFPKSKPFTDKEKKILELAAHHCPVLESLHPDCIKTISSTWPGEE
jgi:uncharacterized OsmC-like protein